jgi:hypothetical protein
MESRAVVRASSLQAWLLMACHVVSSLQSSNPDLAERERVQQQKSKQTSCHAQAPPIGGALTDGLK